jgi:hypothetical protein
MDIELRQRRWRRRFASRREIAGTSPVLAIKRLALGSFSSITPRAILFAPPVTRWTSGAISARARPWLRFFSFKSSMARCRPIFFHPRRKEFQVDQIQWLAGGWHLSHLLHQVEK